MTVHPTPATYLDDLRQWRAAFADADIADVIRRLPTSVLRIELAKRDEKERAEALARTNAPTINDVWRMQRDYAERQAAEAEAVSRMTPADLIAAQEAVARTLQAATAGRAMTDEQFEAMLAEAKEQLAAKLDKSPG